ncbi:MULTISPECIES: glucose 1-dehydrogenase [Bacillus]|jgi:glucose 1-dehydrogenase|uniref:General stress protein, similar to glucose 1-dehydrogenase, survival of ethanol stress and low temperatures n=1 Tax=Bacillus amyloliquefaciens (strain ATCC 23350 / DSM 7 / BCRC 11601 / CCUG 28519 / NBRC 15535 / NRRL B-14393 / F) TaxID=692420 RepID=A0A9P1NGK6_BACAS|nr:glucose 1-dehydrogenase [Bacillus amyloliquefaciens]AIW32363.1 sugar dehydrogenase [Bacillus subtilis]AEB22447.1 general stress protein, glucose 1-dehydrogenase, survival of ethanol stress and low temperatures [Bacillus amyloliquefaciens TA208]AEB61818.1 general stress protein, glucose 1-dehydrogenase, survival of ethanol stress and low temperatures-like protein [Bacillus amyloliquefaciens LL3]AEK87416.1 putative dehydrogenase [Bacillus amyloliquefaciens XH7]ARW37422.1 3-oxoacyl-[acyl-carri
MYQDLQGKTAIVTGSSKGIGKAIAERFGKERMNVVVNYLGDSAGADEAADFIEKAGGRAVTVKADVSSEEGIQALFDAAQEHFGGVDVMVNNSGFNGAEAMPHEMSLEDWQKVIDVNVTGTFLGAKAALNHMLQRGTKGTVLNISSVHQQIPRPENVQYATSKGGIKMMTETMALNYADKGIRVNAIAPGTIATESNEDLQDETHKQTQLKKIPMNAFGKPEEVAAAAAWMVSEEARYVTGTTLFVDGGMTLYPSQLER